MTWIGGVTAFVGREHHQVPQNVSGLPEDRMKAAFHQMLWVVGGYVPLITQLAVAHVSPPWWHLLAWWQCSSSSLGRKVPLVQRGPRGYRQQVWSHRSTG